MRKNIYFIIAAFCCVFEVHAEFCKHCGREYKSARSLVAATCPRFKNKLKHEIFEGKTKSKYFCKKCGRDYTSIKTLVVGSCPKNKDGDRKHSVFEGEITERVTCKKCGRNGMRFKTAVNNRCTRGGYHEILRQIAK